MDPKAFCIFALVDILIIICQELEGMKYSNFHRTELGFHINHIQLIIKYLKISFENAQNFAAKVFD